MQPFTFRLAAVCAGGHETELFSAQIDPQDNASLAAAEAAIGDSGRVATCQTCGGSGVRVRVYENAELVQDYPIDEFNQRAEGNAPPRNYG